MEITIERGLLIQYQQAQNIAEIGVMAEHSDYPEIRDAANAFLASPNNKPQIPSPLASSKTIFPAERIVGNGE
jgi:hypothetical protein